MVESESRPNWEEYALILAKAASTRSEDPWRKCGAAVLRHDNSSAGTGYNGTFPGKTISWTSRDNRQKFMLHAERNCLNYVHKGEGRLLACTHMPCAQCMIEIALKGIPLVVYEQEYKFNGEVVTNTEVTEIANTAGVTLKKITLSPSIQKVVQEQIS